MPAFTQKLHYLRHKNGMNMELNPNTFSPSKAIFHLLSCISLTSILNKEHKAYDLVTKQSRSSTHSHSVQKKMRRLFDHKSGRFFHKFRTQQAKFKICPLICVSSPVLYLPPIFSRATQNGRLISHSGAFFSVF